MVSEWPVVKLGDFVEMKTGLPFKSSQFLDEGNGYKLLRGDNVVQGGFRWNKVKLWPREELTDKQSEFFLDSGDVILAMDRPWIEAGLKTGQITGYDLPCLLVQRVSRLRAVDPADQDFLRYLISSYWFVEYIKLVQTGTAVPHISPKQIQNYEFRKPPKKDRVKIGALMRSLDNKIELNRQTNETLEKMAQALFKSWFVDFDPVIDNALEAGNTIPDELQDRAARRQQQLAKPDHQPLPDDIRQLFPSVFEMTKELGWVPMGWEVSTINDHTHFKNGYAFKSKQLLSSDEKALPVFKMGHINRGGGFKPGGTKSYFPKAEIDEKLSNYLAEKGDLLMSMTDMKSNMVILGNTALMPFSNVFLINQRVARLRIKNDTHLDYPYLYFYTNHPPVVDELRSRANSGVQVNLTSASIKETLLLVPEAPVHSVFDQKIKALLEKSFANDNNSKELGELRDTLLPKLISGELRLPLDALSDAKQKLADATSWQ